MLLCTMVIHVIAVTMFFHALHEVIFPLDSLLSTAIQTSCRKKLLNRTHNPLQIECLPSLTHLAL